MIMLIMKTIIQIIPPAKYLYDNNNKITIMKILIIMIITIIQIIPSTKYLYDNNTNNNVWDMVTIVK